MNLYDGCESNKEIIYGFTSFDFYDKLENDKMKFYHKERKLCLWNQIQVFIQVQELLYILIKFPK